MSKTISLREYKRLITKSKQGWACFYQAEELNHQLHMDYLYQVKKLEKLIEDRDANLYEKAHIPEFVKTELTEMIGQLKKNIECPICYEELPADKIKFSNCGHKYCGTCLSKINECAICRKKIYRKD